MKIIILPIVAIAILSLCYLAIAPANGMSNTSEKEILVTSLDQSLLLKKWKLSHYEVFLMNYEPEKIEKDDYLHFFKDMTYTSISEGKFEKGNYRQDGSVIILTNTTEKGELKLAIKNLTENKLKVVIDEPSDSDAKYVTIHFKSK